MTVWAVPYPGILRPAAGLSASQQKSQFFGRLRHPRDRNIPPKTPSGDESATNPAAGFTRVLTSNYSRTRTLTCFCVHPAFHSIEVAIQVASPSETTEQPASTLDHRGRENRQAPSPRGGAPELVAIDAIASQASCQTEFLYRLAPELLRESNFIAAIVSHPDWDRPRILAGDPSMTLRINMGSVSETMRRSTPSPAAADINLSPTPHAVGPADEPSAARGLHVELLAHPQPSSILLVYDESIIPSPSDQFRDLKRLADSAHHCRRALSRLSTKPSTDQQNRQSALLSFHKDLEMCGTAYRVANEGRRLASCDRVTVLLSRRKRLRVEAVSGVAVIDRRANSVAAAEAFAERAIVLGRPIVLPDQTPLPGQIAEPLDHYLDESNVASVTVVPIRRPQENSATHPGLDPLDLSDPLGVILFESFSASDSDAISDSLNEISREAGVALSNAMEHHRIFGRRALQVLGDWFGGRSLPYAAMAMILMTASLIAALLIQVDHKVIATGYAEPAIQQNVFARTEGIVREILVRDGQTVTAGEPIARLENADLETKAESITGEIQTTAERLASIRSILLDSSTDPKQASRMAIQQRQLQSELSNLENRLQLIRNQISELEIKAPIDGTVAGWQLKRKLLNRPVGRGSHLLTIVCDEGPWQLRLEIPDQDAAEVITTTSGGTLPDVEFVSASHPQSTFAATLESIGSAARRNENGLNVVDAIASIHFSSDQSDRDDLERFAKNETRLGVETTAKINCGRRSLISSWFGDVADFHNRNVAFYVR